MPSKVAPGQCQVALNQDCEYRGVLPVRPYSFASERRRRHRSEQYFTSSQFFSHFLRQVKGRSQTGQTLVGKSDLERSRPIIERMLKQVELFQLQRKLKLFLNKARICVRAWHGSSH